MAFILFYNRIRGDNTMKEVLKLEHIQKYYGNGGNITKAIQDISFSVQEGELIDYS